jgi:hypothetical protein
MPELLYVSTGLDVVALDTCGAPESAFAKIMRLTGPDGKKATYYRFCAAFYAYAVYAFSMARRERGRKINFLQWSRLEGRMESLRELAVVQLGQSVVEEIDRTAAGQEITLPDYPHPDFEREPAWTACGGRVAGWW